jgi:hypothetical protein
LVLMNLFAETIWPEISSKMPIGVGPSELIICLSSFTEATSELDEQDSEHEPEISARFGISWVLLVENIC